MLDAAGVDGDDDLPPLVWITEMLLCTVAAPDDPDRCDPLPVPDTESDPLVNSVGESVTAVSRGIDSSSVCIGVYQLPPRSTSYLPYG